MAVAVRDPVHGAFPFVGADVFGGFGLDQSLDAELCELADKIGSVAQFERGKNFVDGRL